MYAFKPGLFLSRRWPKPIIEVIRSDVFCIIKKVEKALDLLGDIVLEKVLQLLEVVFKFKSN